jgi:putative flippase GtrA
MGVPPLLPERTTPGLGSLALPAVRRVLVYGCVGIAVSLFYSFALVFFLWLLHPISPTVASILAFIITLPVAYLSHAKVSFSDRSYDTFQPLRFALSTAAAFVVSTGGMYLITEIAGRSYLLGIAWTWLMVPAMNLSIYVLWVFRAARHPERPDDRVS